MDTVKGKEDIARSNIARWATKCSMDISYLSCQVSVPADVLSRFAYGDGSLSYAEMLRVCEYIGIPIWAIHFPGEQTDERDNICQVVEGLLAQIPQMAANPGECDQTGSFN